MREEGYYWVKQTQDSDWGIAYWNAELGVWVYELSIFSIGDFAEVDNQKITHSKTYTVSEIMKLLDAAQSACNMPHNGDVLISRAFIEQELGLKTIRNENY